MEKSMKNKASNSCKNCHVEKHKKVTQSVQPLPETSRPRCDGPGGE